MIVNDRTLAWFGLGGTLCDAVGGVYLTFDLLGGRHGPLGFLTRAATYSLLFALAYGAVFGPAFGGVAGLGLGGVLGLEFWRVARHQRLYGSSPLYHLSWFGGARGVVLGLAAMHPFGWQFGLVFGLLSALGLTAIYAFRFAPTNDYSPQGRPRLDKHMLQAAALRGIVVGSAGALAGSIEVGRNITPAFGLLIGLTASGISVIMGMFAPMIEDRVEKMPDMHLAIFGFTMIFLGLVLQSVQYLAVLLK